MTMYRVDYLTKDGKRGIWDNEDDRQTLGELQDDLPDTLKYAKTKMPEIDHLVVVEITEKDVYRLDEKGGKDV